MGNKGGKKKKEINWSVMFGILLTICIVLIAVTVWMFKKPMPKASSGESQETSDSTKGESAKEDEPKENQTEVKTADDLQNEKIKQMVDKMTLEQKAAQLFVVRPEAITGVSRATAAGEATKEALRKYPVGGIIYFTQNLTSPEQTKNMLSNTQNYSHEVSGLPAFLCVDEEGGEVARIGNDKDFSVPQIENMAQIGASKDSARAREVGTIIGSYLSELGFNLDFAPDADVLSNPDNTVVKRRSFGTDCNVVAQMAGEVLKGLQDKNVYGVLKHFPGHGATEGDSHQGYAYTNRSLDEMIANELVPFAKGKEMGAQFIMAAHISAPQVTGDNTPSSLSKVMITDVLRNKLSYDGIVITDALDMGAIKEAYGSDEAAVKAFTAGADMLLMPEDFELAYKGILDGVKNGTITQQRIDESVARILKVKLKL